MIYQQQIAAEAVPVTREMAVALPAGSSLSFCSAVAADVAAQACLAEEMTAAA